MDQDIPTEPRETKASLKFIQEKYDEMRADLKSVLEQNRQSRADDVTLKEHCDPLATQLKATVDCEQNSRNADSEIEGIPDKENLFDI